MTKQSHRGRRPRNTGEGGLWPGGERQGFTRENKPRRNSDSASNALKRSAGSQQTHRGRLKFKMKNTLKSRGRWGVKLTRKAARLLQERGAQRGQYASFKTKNKHWWGSGEPGVEGNYSKKTDWERGGGGRGRTNKKSEGRKK